MPIITQFGCQWNWKKYQILQGKGLNPTLMQFSTASDFSGHDHGTEPREGGSWTGEV